MPLPSGWRVHVVFFGLCLTGPSLPGLGPGGWLSFPGAFTCDNTAPCITPTLISLRHVKVMTFGGDVSWGAFHWRTSRHIQLVRVPWIDPKHTGEIVSHLVWERLRIPQEELKNLAGGREVWSTFWTSCHRDVTPNKQQIYIFHALQYILILTVL